MIDQKWKCKACLTISDVQDLIRDGDPLGEDDEAVYMCPRCRGDELSRVCDEYGCNDDGVCGHPSETLITGGNILAGQDRRKKWNLKVI